MSDSEDKVETETFRRLERLRELRIEHRDLDDVINRLQMDLYVNEVQLRRMKKRKLMLKDQIARLESELIPDLNTREGKRIADSGWRIVRIRSQPPTHISAFRGTARMLCERTRGVMRKTPNYPLSAGRHPLRE